MATTNKNYLTEIHNGLDKALDNNAAALPANFNKARFMQNCMAMLQDGRADFSKCDARTVVRTLLKGSYLGLDFFNGECYAIPYGAQVQFQTDYKGEIKLAKKHSSIPIKDIYAKLVREGDDFTEEIVDGEQKISFRPVPFNDGKILGAFAVCLYQDGSMIYDTMSIAQVEETRKNYSKQANGPAWTKSYGEMVKKTVLRRLCKLITLDFDSAEAQNTYLHDDDSIRDTIGREAGSVVIDMPEPEVEAEAQADAAPDNIDDPQGQIDGQVAMPGF